MGNDNLVAIGGRLRTPDGKLLDFSDKYSSREFASKPIKKPTCHFRVFSYSMFKNDWKDLPKLSQGRQLHSCAVVDFDFQPKIIVVGGRNAEILKSVEIFDYVEQVWVRGQNLKSPTYMSALVSDNKGWKMYLNADCNFSLSHFFSRRWSPVDWRSIERVRH